MDFVIAANDFLQSVWSFILSLFKFLGNSISSITTVFDYIVGYVFELPTIILNIFNSLPDFMRLGFSVMFNCIIFIFVLKIIKIIRDITI